MPTPRTDFAATTGSDGRIYAIGGDSSVYRSTVEAYTPATNSWATLAPMPTARAALAAATGPDGRIYVVGGFGNSSSYLNTVEAYTPTTNTWATMAPMPTARDYLAAATGSDGRIYAIGGQNTSAGGSGYFLSTVEAYTPATNSWATVTPMPTGRFRLAAAAGQDGRVYAIGGSTYSNVPLNTVEAYLPASNTWATLAPTPAGLFASAVTAGQDGRVYAFEGANNTVEAYTPATNGWSTVVPMPTALAVSAAATGSDGRIYAIGGNGTVEAYTPASRLAAGVNVKLIVPSTIASDGAFEENISEIIPSPGNCSFDLYVYTAYVGGFQYLGLFSGTQTNVLVQDYFGYTQYAMVPRDCTGNTGSAVYSVGFSPTTVDNPFSVVSGVAKIITSSKYYGGSALQTSGIGSRVRWSTDCSYNVGVVVGTGPEGGIGTVYADGVKKGTINFYSAKLAGMRVLFKFGTSSGAGHTLDVVTTGHGSGGGSFMNLDAGIENHC